MRLDGRTAITEDGQKRPAPHVVLSVHPEIVNAGAVAWFAARPSTSTYVEGDLIRDVNGLAVKSLTIQPWDLGRAAGLSATDIRSVSVPRILAQAALQIDEMRAWRWPDGTPQPIAVALDATLEGVDALVEFVRIYLEQQAIHGPVGLRERLAQSLYISQSTVRDRLVSATNKGLLTSRGQGKAGRDPGPNFPRIAKTGEHRK